MLFRCDGCKSGETCVTLCDALSVSQLTSILAANVLFVFFLASSWSSSHCFMSSNLYYASSGISLRPGSPHGCPKTESRTSLRPQTQSLQSHQVFNVDLPQATSSPTRLGAKSRSLDDSLSDFSRSMSCDDGSIGRALKVYNECGLYALDDTPQDDSTQRTYSDESSLGFTDSLDLDGSALELPLPLKPAHTHPASRIYFSPPGLGDVSELQQPTLFESGTLERASSPQTLTPEADLPGIYQSTWATCPTVSVSISVPRLVS
jgi:hypothetical protein